MKKLVSLLLLLVFVLAISGCKEKVDFSEPTDLGEKVFEQIFTQEEFMANYRDGTWSVIYEEFFKCIGSKDGAVYNYFYKNTKTDVTATGYTKNDYTPSTNSSSKKDHTLTIKLLDVKYQNKTYKYHYSVNGDIFDIVSSLSQNNKIIYAEENGKVDYDENKKSIIDTLVHKFCDGESDAYNVCMWFTSLMRKPDKPTFKKVTFIKYEKYYVYEFEIDQISIGVCKSDEYLDCVIKCYINAETRIIDYAETVTDDYTEIYKINLDNNKLDEENQKYNDKVIKYLK